MGLESELCLGTMTFGEEWGWGASKEECHKIFNTYVDAGGNFIDTVNNYTQGTSEKYVGEFIADDRDRFVLATKYVSNTRYHQVPFGLEDAKEALQALFAKERDGRILLDINQ